MPYKPQKIDEEWKFLRKSKPEDFNLTPDTAISDALVQKIANALTSLPDGFKPLRQIEKLIRDRKAAFFDKKELGWGRENYLPMDRYWLKENRTYVRSRCQAWYFFTPAFLCGRFSTNESYCQLNYIHEGQQNFKIFNSLLSEFAVLGFEYGYAMSAPNALVIWEANLEILLMELKS